MVETSILQDFWGYIFHKMKVSLTKYIWIFRIGFYYFFRESAYSIYWHNLNAWLNLHIFIDKQLFLFGMIDERHRKNIRSLVNFMSEHVTPLGDITLWFRLKKPCQT